MIRDNYFIITGAMGAGKTTVINLIREMNIHCIDEPARVILKEQRSINGEGVPERNPALFNHLMLERMIRQYIDNSHRSELIIFDRGIPDIIAYEKLLDTTSEESAVAIHEYKYNINVFFLNGWKEIYVNDEERKVDFDTADQFGKSIKQIYEALEYRTIDVPFDTAQERASLILNSIVKILNK